ncbi:MAG TPA: DUF3306 domain-containing protein [Burkholderiales bacterium]|nr:DUF3306 domain-containing protein [Burkholderiales bacterium]
MSEEKEAFLSRWSRLKREPPIEKTAEPETPAPVLPPALPPVESLTPESDFAGFMHPKVEDDLRRLALKKLFGDPHFNVADPFEPFSGDWTGGEPITPELLATLNQARSVLFSEQEKKPEAEPAQKTEGEPKQDEPGRQDT